MFKYALTILGLFVLLSIISSFDDDAKSSIKINVDVEEKVYEFESAKNGASPMWCYGNTCIARYGDRVVASGLETIKDVKILHNVRWTLFERTDAGKWRLIKKDMKDRTREPCPMGVFNNGQIFLSVNPTLTKLNEYSGPAEPQILQFDINNLDGKSETLLPAWEGVPEFTEHSYRSFAVDASSNEMIIFQNIGYTHAEWSFRDKKGKWKSNGKLIWPWGSDYEEPVAIRVCYPSVQLKDREVHFLGVSDIMEPNKEWRDYKYKITGRKWDYDFRRLFYTYSDDIGNGEFHDWIEITSREKTGGNITPCDLWVAPSGMVHILWLERALDERLWKDFFPDEKQKYILNYAILKKGKVVAQKAIMESSDLDEVIPGKGRFHVTPNNRLFVFYYVHSKNDDFKENRLIEIYENNRFSKSISVELRQPFSNFFTASVRGGSAPSNYLDVFGKSDVNEMRYARIQILGN